MKQDLAQFFTPPHLALRMAKLLQNSGSLLEPSCGDGALLRAVVATEKDFDCTGIELDDTKISADFTQSVLISQDFFSYPTEIKFDAVLSNPPYLKASKIPETTRNEPNFITVEKILGGYANLYAYFILKSFLHLNEGSEMVFVVPSDCFYVTGNAKLLQLLHQRGTFTHVVKFKKSPFLPEVSQEVVVWRYEKDNMSHQTRLEVV